MPTVSVLMPNYNKAPFLPAAIASVQAQTLSDWELILVDDGSTDGSWKIIAAAAAADPRIRAFRQAHAGINQTRNFALAQARSEFLAVLDSDDECHPERLAKQAAYLEEHPDCGVVGSNYEVIDEQGRRLRKVSQPLTDKDIREAFFFFNPVRHSALCFRQACVRELGGYSLDWFGVEDLEILMRFGTRWQLANLPEYLARYRVFANNFSHQFQGDMIRNTLRLRRQAVRRWGYQFTVRARLAYAFTGLMLFLPPATVAAIFSGLRRLFNYYEKN